MAVRFPLQKRFLRQYGGKPYWLQESYSPVKHNSFKKEKYFNARQEDNPNVDQQAIVNI